MERTGGGLLTAVTIVLLTACGRSCVEAGCQRGFGDCTSERSPVVYTETRTVSFTPDGRSEHRSRSSKQFSSFVFRHRATFGDGGSFNLTHRSNTTVTSTSNSTTTITTNQTSTATTPEEISPTEAPMTAEEAPIAGVEEHVPVAGIGAHPPEPAGAESIEEPLPAAATGDLHEGATTPLVEAPEPLPPPIVASPVLVFRPVPKAFHPCGYPKPQDPGERPRSGPTYYDAPQDGPCPIRETSPSPDPVPAPVPAPLKVASPALQKPSPAVPPPTTPSNPVSQPAPVLPKSPPRKRDSAATAKKVKELLKTKNITALAEFVIESDDIYGLTMGLRFSQAEREVELQKTVERSTDKDVIAIKALALAALNPKAVGKVIQLMVLAATSPNGYHFTQHRALVERLTIVFTDKELLKIVVASNPQEYLRRRLLCAGCTPLNSYICAHCWPNKICSEYFWCPAEKQKSRLKITRPSSAGKDVQPAESAPKAVPLASPRPQAPAAPVTESKSPASHPKRVSQKSRARRRSRRRRYRRRSPRSSRTRNRRRRSLSQ